MQYKLEHIAILCKDLKESIGFYERLFGGKATPIRKGSAGYGFCFIDIEGQAPIQLMESDGRLGVHHYGFIAENVEKAAEEFKQKGAKIIRENRDAGGKLTTVFLQEPNGLEIEVRIPR